MTQGQLVGHNSPLVGHTKLKTSRNVTGQQSSSCYVEYSQIPYTFRVISVEEDKEEEEERRGIKSKFFNFGFLNLVKGYQNFWSRFTLEQQREVVCKLFELLCFVFLGAAPIPYVQAAILTWPILNLRSTTVVLDSTQYCINVYLESIAKAMKSKQNSKQTRYHGLKTVIKI